MILGRGDEPSAAEIIHPAVADVRVDKSSVFRKRRGNGGLATVAFVQHLGIGFLKKPCYLLVGIAPAAAALKVTDRRHGSLFTVGMPAEPVG